MISCHPESCGVIGNYFAKFGQSLGFWESGRSWYKFTDAASYWFGRLRIKMSSLPLLTASHLLLSKKSNAVFRCWSRSLAFPWTWPGTAASWRAGRCASSRPGRRTRRRTGTRGPSPAASQAVCGMGQNWHWPLSRSWGEENWVNWGTSELKGEPIGKSEGNVGKSLKEGKMGKKLIWVRVCQCAIRLCNNGPSWNGS